MTKTKKRPILTAVGLMMHASHTLGFPERGDPDYIDFFIEEGVVTRWSKVQIAQGYSVDRLQRLLHTAKQKAKGRR